MQFVYLGIFQLALEIIVFFVLMVVFDYVFKKLGNSNIKILNPREYFPQEEIHSLRQISILIMMGLFFINILYSFIFINDDIIYLVVFDILLSLYLAIKLDKSTWKNRIILILLIPYGSLTFLIFGGSLVGLLDFIHIPIFIYFMKVYYVKFREYTSSNGLGITILLLFTIVFVSFLFTQVFENVNPLDSLVMVSNAFTSNGYAVLGKTGAGKIDSIILVWSGYLLSGVGTATLTAGILINHYKNKLKKMDEKLDRIESMMMENNKD